MELVLNRNYYREGTYGALTLNGKFICFILELPWKQNNELSCIPEGSYEVRPRYSQRFGNHLVLKNVLKRRNIFIRTGIYLSKETKGNLLPICQLSGIATGLYSRIALQRILDVVYGSQYKGEEVLLVIKSKCNEYN